MIENYIPAGYKNRVSRQYLALATGLPDRAVRAQIEEAADRGILICSVDGGYFRRAGEQDDPYILAYMAQEQRRFKTMSHKNKRLKEMWGRIHPEKHDKQIPGQLSFNF